jgi:polysaccharide biosynthesis transport protein
MPLDQLQLIPTLRARWPVVVLTWVVIVAAVAALSLALPPRYEATATVVADVSGTDPIGGQAVFKPAGAVSTHIATQVEIMRSEQVARGALRSLGLHEQQEWRDRWMQSTEGRGDFEAWLAGELLRALEVRPSRDTNVLNLSYSSRDPEFSSAVVNAFVKSYIDTTVQMQAEPARQFNVFFAERAKPLREALEQARARLSAYEKEHGVVVTDERDVESERLTELISQLVFLQGEAAEADHRGRQAANAPGNMRELRRDPEVVALMTELARMEGRLTELRHGFGEQHPGVIEAREAVAELRQRLNASMQRAAGSIGAASNVARARVAEVQAAIDRQRALVLQRKSRRDAAAALVRDVDNAQRAYDAVLNRASQTALESANTTQTNVSVLKSASPPPSPRSLLHINLIVAMLLGLLLGIARALVAESRDRRVRTVEDVTHRLRQPLLLALPDGGTRRGRAARRSEQTRQRLVSPRPGLAAPK